MRRASRTITLGLGHACCTGVLCEHGRDAAALDPALARGGDTLILRGVPTGRSAAIAERARRAGFREIVIATAALDVEVPEGADVVRAVLFSHVPTVHDRLAGRDGALPGALVGLRALAARGTAIEIEIPILPARLSDPVALVELVGRALETCPAARLSFRFVLPARAVPAAVAPPRLDALEPALSDAMARAEALGARVRVDPSQGLPPCTFPGDPVALARYSLRRGRARGCEGCAVRTACAGPTEAYRAAHGAAGLRPFRAWPAALTGRPDDRRPRWTATEREAARHVRYVVLRPTVHCNQDCLFCSANESSNNVWSEPVKMMKQIARFAQRGVRRISFSGGEPTLSPHLRDFVHVAKRCGVPEIELVTNGVLLDRAPRVARLADAGLTHAFVSLHAHDEALSRAMTQKVDDHAKTLAAIEHLLRAEVVVVVNHVVTARNQAYLGAFVDMVHARFGGRVSISFAFVTPQFKALEHIELVPSLEETIPHLHRAMRRAEALRQPFVVGSRQGVPPCLLGPFAAWSDVFGITSEAASEDTPQKVQGPACARCRYRAICRGLWRAYAERHGTDELVAVEGEPFTEAELEAIRGHHRKPPFGVPLSFAEAPPLLRDRAAERAPPPPVRPPPRALPVAPATRTRPLRALFVGTGRRARALAEAGAEAEIAVAGVVSPHALDRPGWWGAAPAFRDLAEAIEAVRPEAIVVAAATETHVAIVEACADQWVLLEKPVATHLDRAAPLAGRPRLSCALQELFAPGLAPALEATGPVRITRACPADAVDAPRAWGRAPLFEALHHALTIPVVTHGPVLEAAVRFEGGSRPTRLSLELGHARGASAIELDYRAGTDRLEVRVGDAAWERRGREVFVGGAPVEHRRGELPRMMDAFRTAVLRDDAPPVPIARGLEVLEATERVLEALAAAGAPLVRAGAPKHVASPTYRTGPSRR